MLNPGAFTNPSRYLETEETMQQINDYTEFLTGQNTKNPGVKVYNYLLYFMTDYLSFQ